MANQIEKPTSRRGAEGWFPTGPTFAPIDCQLLTISLHFLHFTLTMQPKRKENMMPNVETNPAPETTSGKETIKEIGTDVDAGQDEGKESGSASGQAQSESVNFSQMYDMLTERDTKIKTMTDEIANLKKTNTELLLKVNAASSSGAAAKDPYMSFIDEMEKR